MKPLSIIVTAASILLGNAAYAAEPKPSVSECWPVCAFTPSRSTDETKPRGNGTGVFTTDEINWALKARGEPPLGSVIVRYDGQPR